MKHPRLVHNMPQKPYKCSRKINVENTNQTCLINAILCSTLKNYKLQKTNKQINWNQLMGESIQIRDASISRRNRD